MVGCYDTGTTGNVWPNWVSCEDSSSTSGTTTNYVWAVWATNATNATDTTDASTTWRGWVREYGIGRYSYIHPPAVAARQPTPEEIEAQKKAQEEWARQQEEARKARERADKRARKLFLDVIGRKKYKAFRRKKYIEIIAGSGKRYRLKLQARVEEMAGPFGDKVASYLCVHPDGVPAYDALLTQLLFLVSGRDAEEKLVKTANRTPAAVA